MTIRYNNNLRSAGYFVIETKKLSLHLQESHQERIGEDEFPFAEGKFDVDKFLVLVDFYNDALMLFEPLSSISFS